MSLDEKSFLYISELTFTSIIDCIRHYNEVVGSGCDKELLDRMHSFYLLKAQSYVELWSKITGDYSNENLRNEKLILIEEAIRKITI